MGTYHRHYCNLPNILATHDLSGCDTVCSYFSIEEKTVMNVLNKKNIDLSSIGFLDETLGNYLKQGINFLRHFYGQSKEETLNDARKKMWKYSIAKSKSGASKLESLQSIDESSFFFSELETKSLADSRVEMFVKC